MSRPDPDVAIVDGSGANIASLQFALERLGARSEVTADRAKIARASHVILPGVGAARTAMDRLRALGFDAVLPNVQQPLLGICLGMQLLFEHSEEDNCDCLGIVPGLVRRFQPAPGHPVPHMGWNQVERLTDSRLLAGVPDRSHFYFTHSFAAAVSDSTVGQATYGWPFAAVMESGNFMATQFHPERSGAAGAAVLRNFLGCG